MKNIFLGRRSNIQNLFLGAHVVPKKLPYDAEVEYLESTGTQWIELLFGFDNTDEIHTSFSISESTADKFMVSTKTWNTNNNRFGMGGGYRYQCGYGSYQTGATYLSPLTDNDNTIRLWNYAGRIFSVPSLGLSLDCASISWGGATTQIRLFFGYNSPSKGKIASYRHVKNGNDVADLIPVRFTNELGQTEGAMYDKVSGRLFRNQGTGSFIVGRDINPISARSYVNDGLIAMWDGVENSGWGVHNASATTWEDIVGGHDVTLGAGLSFASNALVCTAQGIATGTSISESIAAIEFVEFHSVRQDGMPFQLQSSRQCVLRGNYDTYSFSQNATDSSMPYQFGRVHAVYVALASDGAIDTCYIDGVDVTSQKRARDANIGYYGGVRIGGATASYFPYAGSLHALRVRSRALTAAEIAANYAIDKARFNLP